jgi:hypothetical protein
MTRLVRRIAAVLALFALAFAQLAVSAYACPVAATVGHEVASATTSEAHCGDLDNANLCDRHCDYGVSAVANASADSLPPFVATALPGRIEIDSRPAAFARAADRQSLRCHSPPALILFGVLRI